MSVISCFGREIEDRLNGVDEDPVTNPLGPLVNVSFHLNETVKDAIEIYAEFLGISRSEFMRQCITSEVQSLNLGFDLDEIKKKVGR